MFDNLKLKVCFLGLSSVARYRGKISYLPVTDKKLLRKTRLIVDNNRLKFGESHFDCKDVQSLTTNLLNLTDNYNHLSDLENNNYKEIDLSSSIKEAFKGKHLVEVSKYQI